MESVGIILQARMGSQRLPGKVLMDISGHSLLEHIVCRVRLRAANVPFVIATSTESRDDSIGNFCKLHHVKCFRGSEGNVLERYVRCAELYNFSHIVRMTGDNPFPDIDEMKRLIDFHKRNRLQFSENLSVLPEGVGMEILSKEALEESLQKGFLPKHFEHVDEYVLDHLECFRHGCCDVSNEKKFPKVRLTVDTLEDLQCARYIAARGSEGYITTELAIQLRMQYEKKLFEGEGT